MKYSNCFIEALSETFRDPENTELIFLKGGIFGERSHFMWYKLEDGEIAYVEHIYNPIKSGNKILYKVAKKRVSFVAFEAFALDCLKTQSFEKTLEIATKLRLKSLKIPGVLYWANYIEDPEWESLPKIEDYKYLEKILGGKLLTKVLVDGELKSVSSFEELDNLGKTKDIKWKYITPFDEDYKEIQGWFKKKDLAESLQ